VHIAHGTGYGRPTPVRSFSIRVPKDASRARGQGGPRRLHYRFVPDNSREYRESVRFRATVGKVLRMMAVLLYFTLR
jgi:hypothetical protein